jgi:rod shape determining protein RodA
MATPTLTAKLWRVQWGLVVLLAALGAIGVAALYSTAGGSIEPWAERHALRLALGLGLLLFVAVVPIRFWFAIAYPFYAVALGLLIVVALSGIVQMGARRWIILPGGLSFQPSELMKVAIILALARYYATLSPRRVSRPLFVLIPLVAILVPAVLVQRQPDLGTALLIASSGAALMFLSGLSWFYLVGAAGAFAIAAPYAWQHMHDYQRNRVLAFLDPDRDPLTSGYHVLQSKIALGSGGLDGKGFLAGTQSQLNFLPEKHTDFIFTTFAEEMGFTGAVGLMGLYAAVLVVLGVMAYTTRHLFGRLVIAGSAWTLGIYVLINMAMVMGLAPVVGVPLPLVSYGGTAMTSLLFLLGLAMCAHVHRDARLHSAAARA